MFISIAPSFHSSVRHECNVGRSTRKAAYLRPGDHTQFDQTVNTIIGPAAIVCNPDAGFCKPPKSNPYQLLQAEPIVPGNAINVRLGQDARQCGGTRQRVDIAQTLRVTAQMPLRAPASRGKYSAWIEIARLPQIFLSRMQRWVHSGANKRALRQRQ